MRVAAVVPTWCEAPQIGGLVGACAREVDEVVVADAASPDGTAEAAARAGARVVQGRKGRGPQLNEGARAARADALVFVHADAGVPPGFGAAIRAALADPRVVGGNFALRFDHPSAAARLFTLGNDLRRRLFGVYYGDSCIFVRRTVFDALGGFDDVPLFEDCAFARKLERAGPTRYVTEPAVAASARRFEGRPLRTLALWAGLQLAYELGAPPRRLARFYADARAAARPRAQRPPEPGGPGPTS
ncbi:MAG TPA: glycosyltransferase [Polyangiaceae bacterium]|nr:glycosyltransferase [Polyangiaceae bacterium]